VEIIKEFWELLLFISGRMYNTFLYKKPSKYFILRKYITFRTKIMETKCNYRKIVLHFLVRSTIYGTFYFVSIA
jgi:hypothetical protein